MSNDHRRAIPRRSPHFSGHGVLLSRACAALFAVGMLGCASSQQDEVMASVNAWDFYNHRYDERCVPTGPVGCSATNAALKTWKKGLDEAGVALTRGGEIPLQVAHVKRLEKEAKKCLPK